MRLDLNRLGPLLPCLILIGLVGCGGPNREDSTPLPSASSGQVTAAAAVPKVSSFAAARFAEQVSFGPTSALVQEIQTKGYSKWIDEQFALAPSQIDVAPHLGYPEQVPPEQWLLWRRSFPDLAVGAPDQLRLRVTWALSQFIVVSERKMSFESIIFWINMLQNKALGRYDDLLYNISVSPTMGVYLDNVQNRPKSAECPHCAPNENYARELMQLFSIGVVKLNPDGTYIKDAQGRFAETYTQRDVEELARVLTGWMFNPDPANRPGRNFGNWSKPMVPSTWPPERDSGAKVVLGKTFPAGQSQDRDLRDAVNLLMAHPNIAPFIATRLIQHLVKSNPTPAYVGRISAVFRNNGSGVVGDMKAVVKAILLDAEARAGDSPNTARIDDGKIREPFLVRTAAWRGMGCKRHPFRQTWVPLPANQVPFNAESVFSYYAPTDRAPGSNLLAPEQRLINSNELTSRLNLTTEVLWWDPATQRQSLSDFNAAECEAQSAITAYQSSSRDFSDWLSIRYFKGAMPPTLRANIDQIMRAPPWNPADREYGTMRMIDYALSTPYFGVIK